MVVSGIKSAVKRSLIGLCQLIERTPRREDSAIVTLLHEVGGTPSGYNIDEAVFRDQLEYLLAQKVIWYRATMLASKLQQLDDSAGICITFDDGTLSGYRAAVDLVEAGAACTHFIIPDRINSMHANTMTWSQVRELDAAGVEIGSHSQSHPHLTRLSKEQIERELKQSKSVIEDKIGREVTAFAYPYGEYNQRIIDGVADSGYDCAFTTRHLYASTKTDKFQIPRFEPLDALTDLEEIYQGRGHWFYRLLNNYYQLSDAARL